MPLARHRSVAIFWWSLAVAFEGWLSLRATLSWAMGALVRLEGSFGERVMADWDAAVKA